jgi:hypothetical protein
MRWNSLFVSDIAHLLLCIVSPFVPKKFPNELKPSTLRVAQMALDMNEYDECFFIRLAQLFPYNTFTIKVCKSSKQALQVIKNSDHLCNDVEVCETRDFASTESVLRVAD